MDGARVLVVDDDADLLKLVRRELTRAGIASDAALSAADALALMERHVYPVVIVDVNLPGMSGVRLLADLKRHNSLVQVLMLTGEASLERVIECLDHGATDFFAKSAGLAGLVEAVGAALNRSARWLQLLGAPRGAPGRPASVAL